MRVPFLLFLLGLSLVGTSNQSWAAKIEETHLEGKHLYEHHCEGCHNTDGSGGIGVALRPKKMAILTDQYIRQSIRLGRAGRLMPAYAESLSTAEIEAITRYMRVSAEHAEPGLGKPILNKQMLAGNAERGQLVYQAHCAECHENNERLGGLGTGIELSRTKAFPVMPVSLSNEGFQDSITDAELHYIISREHNDLSVAACDHESMSETQSADLVHYIRTLRKTAKVKTALLEESPVFMVNSPYDLDTTVNNVREAISSNNYRVFPNRYLEQGLVEESKVDKNQVLIRFCNFEDFYELLKVDPRVGLALPCTITVIKTDDGVKLIAPNPAQLAPMFNNDELIRFSERIGTAISWILEEATL